MSSVFVADQQRKPLDPIHPGRARHLSAAGHAAVNATPWVLYQCLASEGLPLETGSGGRTKWNRKKQGFPKAHWLDAACVGASSPNSLTVQGSIPLLITAKGRHSRQMSRTNAYGFPDKAPKATSVVGGFRTGDIVRAKVTARGTIQGIHYRYCQTLHRADGYGYTKGAASPPLA